MHPFSFCAGQFAMLALTSFTTAALLQAAPPRPPDRFAEIMSRDVRNAQGEELGSVGDLLVQMPSGRIVFVAVDPMELFERPKVVPPGALKPPASEAETLVVDISKDRWIEAPRLDWNSALVIDHTDEGGRIYGYYQEHWRQPERGGHWNMTVVAPAPGAPPVRRYASLKQLMLERVETSGKAQVGYLRDFLVDWAGRRVTHALVSPRFTPRPGPEPEWYAVPVVLLVPPVESDAVGVNSGLEAFRLAPVWPGPDDPRPETTTIYRYTAPEPPANPRPSRTAGARSP